MTVKQLKEELSKYPDDMDVFLDERQTEFQFGLLNGVYKKEISFKEDPEDEEGLASDTVVILSEE